VDSRAQNYLHTQSSPHLFVHSFKRRKQILCACLHVQRERSNWRSIKYVRDETNISHKRVHTHTHTHADRSDARSARSFCWLLSQETSHYIPFFLIMSLSASQITMDVYKWNNTFSLTFNLSPFSCCLKNLVFFFLLNFSRFILTVLKYR